MAFCHGAAPMVLRTILWLYAVFWALHVVNSTWLLQGFMID